MDFDFINDLKEYAIKQLEYHNIAYDKNSTAHRLFMRVDLFYKQYILPQPRKVMISKKINSLGLSLDTQESLNKMVEWVESGVDINPFQSRSLKNKNNKDLQYSLYGTRHLHLSAEKNDLVPKVDKKGFADSGKYILIALFEDNIAYFIDVIEHPQTNLNNQLWTKQEILEIMENDFPHLVEGKCIKGATLIESIDDDAINKMTFNGFSIIIETSKGVYFPPEMGVVSSGDSLMNVRDTDEVFNRARQLQEWLQSNYPIIIKTFDDEFEKVNGIKIKSFDFHYKYSSIENEFVISEENTGCYYIPSNNKLYVVGKTDSK